MHDFIDVIWVSLGGEAFDYFKDGIFVGVVSHSPFVLNRGKAFLHHYEMLDSIHSLAEQRLKLPMHPLNAHKKLFLKSCF